TFLSWGRFPTKTDAIDLVRPVLFFSNSDYAIYVGPICVLLLLYSLLNIRRIRERYVYLSWLACLILMTLFSLGPKTPVATFLYNYYPAMKYYRHVGYAIIYVTLFAPLLAGFGFDALIDRLSSFKKPIVRHVIIGLLLFAGI